MFSDFLSAAVLFIWGTLCLKLSHVHFSHNLFLKRLNVLVLCTSVLLEILQPDLNIYRVRVPFSLLQSENLLLLMSKVGLQTNCHK